MDKWFHYVVYNHPSDYPDHLVVRRWEITKSGPVPEKDIFLKAGSLEELSTELYTLGLVRTKRAPDDDPAILEIWI